MIDIIIYAVAGMAIGILAERIGTAVSDKEATLRRSLPLMIAVALYDTAVSAFIGYMLKDSVVVLVSLVALAVASFASVTDVRSKTVVGYAIAAQFVIAAVAAWLDGTSRLTTRLIGCAFAFVLMFALRKLGAKVAEREALGMGDVLFGTAIGLHLGLTGFLVAGVFASVVAFGYIVVKKAEKKAEIDYPFVPALAVGFTITMSLSPILTQFFIV